MYLKLLLPLIISIYFNSADLISRYVEEVYNNEELKELNIRQCADAKTDINARVNTCRRVFKLLRNDTKKVNPYRYSLYLDYKAFQNPSNPVCEEKFIRISENILEKHISLSCYDRLAVITKTTEYHKEISILFGPQDSVIVLVCSGYAYCELLKWFEKSDGSSFSELPAPVESIAVRKLPVRADVEELDYIFQKSKKKVYCMSVNNSHFIHNMETDDFAVLCSILLRRPEYTKRCKLIKENPKKISKYYDLTVYHPFVEIGKLIQKQPIKSYKRTFRVKAYPCTHCVTRHHIEKSFKLMAGQEDTSVIIIEPADCNEEPCFIPIELIKNVDTSYIHQIEDYF